MITAFADAASLLLSVGGNLSLVWLFGAAWLSPVEHQEFVVRTGLLLCLMEFLSTHASAMWALQSGAAARRRTRARTLAGIILPVAGRIYFVAFYSLFALVIGASLQNLYAPLVFFVSLVSKVLARNASPHGARTMFLFLFLLMASLSIAGLISPTLEKLSPLPAALLAQLLDGTSGLADRPRLFVLWGVLYYLSAALLEVALFVRQRKRRERATAGTEPMGPRASRRTIRSA